MNNPEQIRRFIFTGTPGSGKTSVIKELERLGHRVIHEAATDVIADCQLNGIERPWEDCPDFLEAIIYCQKERQLHAKGPLQFYDRSPFCTYALGRYLSISNNVEVAPSSFLLEEIDRCLKGNIYQNKIFFFENLGFIPPTDARKISYEEALIFEKIHLDVYKEFGFDIIKVPRELTVAQRCDFILKM